MNEDRQERSDRPSVPFKITKTVKDKSVTVEGISLHHVKQVFDEVWNNED